jgi:hypothetical protein
MKPKYTGSKRTASGNAAGKSRNASRNSERKYPYLAICVRNDGNEASLERGKTYRVIKPLPSDPPQRIRVIDEENEDYLYRADWFVPIQVPLVSKKSVLRAVSA